MFFAKNGTGSVFTKQGADLHLRQSRIAWGRGLCVRCVIVGEAGAVSVFVATDVSRDFCERFFAIVGL